MTTQPNTETPLYSPVPMTTMTTNSPNGIGLENAQVNAIPRPVIVGNVVNAASNQGRLVSSCTEVARRAGRLLMRRRWELIPVGVTSGLAYLGWMQENAWATFGYSAFGAAGVGAFVLGLLHKHPKAVEGGTLVALGCGELATWTAAGPSWPGVTAFAFATGLGYWHFGPWLKEHRDKRMKLHIDTVKAKGALPDALGLEAADPGLTGATPEETALRRAIHALTGVTPLDVPAFQYNGDGGFEAVVAMPPGKSTSPAAIIPKATQLAANLGMPGRLFLEQGSPPNLLKVRLVVKDVLDGTIPWTGPSITSILQPMLLAYADDGTEIRQTLFRNHVFVAGASDNGKSGVINLIICNLLNCDDVDTYGIDLKAGAPELGIYRDVFKMLATTPEQARFLLEWIEEEYYRRGELLGGLGDDGIPVRQWKPGEHGKAIVVVTDEKAELVEQDPELATLYRRLAALVRYVGIILVSATQTPSAKVFGGDKDGAANYQVQVGLRVLSPTQTNIVMGAGMHGQGWKLSELDAPGKCMVRSRENPIPKRAKAIYVNDHDIAAEIQRHRARLGLPAPAPTAPAEPPRPNIKLVRPRPQLHYPSGEPVGQDEWPDLYRVFCELCEKHGDATKEELTATGPFNSRDTVRRALEVWERHGVQSRREGRATRYYLPETLEEDAS